MHEAADYFAFANVLLRQLTHRVVKGEAIKAR
jgi:hypothetical protein